MKEYSRGERMSEIHYRPVSVRMGMGDSVEDEISKISQVLSAVPSLSF